MDLSSDPFGLPPLSPPPQSLNPLTSDAIVVDTSELLTSDNPEIMVHQSLWSSDDLLNNNSLSAKEISASTHRPISYNRKRGPPGPSTNHLMNKEP